MNPETVIFEAAEAIAQAYSLGLIRGHLCWWDGKLSVHQRRHTSDQHKIFMHLDPTHFSEGLSSPEWEKLKQDLLTFFTEGN